MDTPTMLPTTPNARFHLDDLPAPLPPNAAGARRAKTDRQRGELLSCEHDELAPERELEKAMERYKQKSGRMFPTWSEVLEVCQGLGYQKPD